ncbi:MAG TPA: hypothetical protein VGP13_03390 [Candidatus Paceibacterota bacterium]|jgi:hypothetical protein|nr:hypothetical protein [Candidatus Paceibacterota bacterium]
MHETLAQRVINIASKGPVEKAKLLQMLERERAVTPQAVYKALRQLNRDEVISIHKDTVSLSIIWIQKEIRRLSQVATTYQTPVYQTYFGALKPKQKFTYTFRTLRDIDTFWVNAVLVTVQSGRHAMPLVSIVPHDWFQLLRPDTDVAWDDIAKKNAHFVVLTHSTTAEKKKSTHPGIQVFERMFNVNPLKQKESVYFNILGDFIFEAHLDPKVLPAIRHAMLNDDFDAPTILATPGHYKFIVENNPAKALAIKKRVQKYFTKKLF